jgi:hypothetical protein
VMNSRRLIGFVLRPRTEPTIMRAFASQRK